MKTCRITITGLVQGVGFRPFIYRIAHEEGLKGWVNNTNENVTICFNAGPDQLERFMSRIRSEAPPAALIDSVEVREGPQEEFEDFRILESASLSEGITEVSPDLAACEDCLEDMKSQQYRIDYPFLNCTNCGPRFTIIRDLPYDRGNTTMAEFGMCEDCRKEYENVMDRRFHAQPTACSNCGPRYSLRLKDGTLHEGPEIPALTADLIDAGEIVTIKGLGGFFMACDAMNEKAVARLRRSKHREGKPFAVMFGSMDRIRNYCSANEQEEELLTSWRRPIVILENREIASDGKTTGSPERNPGKEFAPSVSNGFSTTGVMLPYMPIHYLLFAHLKTTAIVLTSGNLSDEPILIDNERAETVLGPVSGAVLHYNRDIQNRCDDSVTMVVNGNTMMMRRSRGYVPSPIRMKFDTEGIFAAGAELVNCFAIGKGRQAILSQHIGDLQNFETYEFYRETVDRFSSLFRFRPALVAHDLHPDYLSTRFARELDLPLVSVQHHHAHIASVLAEHGVDEQVIGVSFDGTGLGDDGNIWGSEFMVCDLAGYRRYSHLQYLPMPGGDKAVHEPWRLAVSLLYQTYGSDLIRLELPFLQSINPTELDLVLQQLEKGLNCPLSSGAGRLFDAIAALTGVCTHASFHAEAPMRLEGIIMDANATYDYFPGESIDTSPLTVSIVRDLQSGMESGIISARFHNTMVGLIKETVKTISRETGIKKAAFSGGSFQNRYLASNVENQLAADGFEILMPRKLPPNDGGIALGQLAIAAKLRSQQS